MEIIIVSLFLEVQGWKGLQGLSCATPTTMQDMLLLNHPRQMPLLVEPPSLEGFNFHSLFHCPYNSDVYPEIWFYFLYSFSSINLLYMILKPWRYMYSLIIFSCMVHTRKQNNLIPDWDPQALQQEKSLIIILIVWAPDVLCRPDECKHSAASWTHEDCFGLMQIIKSTGSSLNISPCLY